MNVEYEKLFAILRSEPEIEVIINPFISSLVNRAMDQLEGQVGGAKIAMARLSSPNLYYVLSGNDFNLDINDPKEPKIFCMGNNPQKQLVYNAVLSLLATRLIKLVNKKGKMKCSLVIDELPTIYITGVDGLLATARSNKVATSLVVQDLSQLKKDYGRDQAEVIMNITGNIICGQVSGDTAKQISDRFGKIIQEKGSVSINSSDTSISRSYQLDMALPPSKIASLSSGEFVGMMADDPNHPMDLKSFHAKINMDHAALKKEQDKFQPIPAIRKIDKATIQRDYLQIKNDIEELVLAELDRISNDPALSDRMIQRHN
jgi:type IV secretory pathway TraG/TraD family ATPase VirD4